MFDGKGTLYHYKLLSNKFSEVTEPNVPKLKQKTVYGLTGKFKKLQNVEIKMGMLSYHQK